MSLGVLNNISAMYAENNLNQTQSGLQKTLQQLSSGSRINSGADDAAGLAIVNGLAANSAALTQSSANASQGVGLLQVADGALSQVTNLLNRAVTLSTEASAGTLSGNQMSAADQEFQDILSQINTIGSTTEYNGISAFSSSQTNVFTSDGYSAGSHNYSVTVGTLSTTTGVGTSSAASAAGAAITSTVGAATGTGGTSAGAGTGTILTGTKISDQADAEAALHTVTDAINAVAYQRGQVGANINTLNAAANVESTEQVNTTSAQNTIQATDYGQASSNLSKYQILSQTGISALAQANSTQQQVLKLLQ